MKHSDFYLSAKALRITEPARTALLQVKADLASGKIGPHNYNQGETCGTQMCIGGHMAVIMGVSPGDYVSRHSGRSALAPLFWGRMDSRASPEEAAVAIDRFLLGKEPWVDF